MMSIVGAADHYGPDFDFGHILVEAIVPHEVLRFANPAAADPIYPPDLLFGVSRIPFKVHHNDEPARSLKI